MTDRHPESGREQRRAAQPDKPSRQNYVMTLDEDWVLSVVQNANGSTTARIAREDEAYELTSMDATMLELPAFGYIMSLSFDQNGVPCVIWSREGGGSPFVWFCVAGVAGWSQPLTDPDYA